MIYQDPLAYLLGLEGVALLDAWAGDHDREFVEARLAEILRLLDDDKLRDRAVLAERVSTVTAYERHSARYDAEAGGGLFAVDEPVVTEFLSARAPGVALDAACGTGRFAEFLATVVEVSAGIYAYIQPDGPMFPASPAGSRRASTPTVTSPSPKDRRCGPRPELKAWRLAPLGPAGSKS